MGIRGLVLLVALVASGGVQAKDYARQMEFVEYRPCTGNGSMCAPVYLAQGTIDPGAAERLALRLRSTPDHPRTIAFDSPGGSLAAGLDLGRLIRRERLDTIVAPNYFQESPPATIQGESEIEIVASDAGCYSACAYAFMGGVSRTVAKGGQIGVHQFSGLELPAAEAGAQVGVAILSRYLQDMGIDRELLDVASITDAGDMVVVPESYARRYNLDNQVPALEEWRLEALPGGEMGLAVDQPKQGSDARIVLGFLTSPDPQRVDVLVLLHRIDPRSYALLVAGIVGEVTQSRICAAANDCIALSPKGTWQARGEGAIYARMSVDRAALLAMAADSEAVFLDAGFPQAYESLGPDVVVTRAGLRDGLATLLRHQ